MLNNDSIFSNLKVIELASVLAGPSTSQFFAELGAEVIKIENPKTKGDVTRSWKGNGEVSDDVSAYFSCVNWGKKSLSLDISKEEGLNILYKLVLWADLIITSYKPGDDVKLKVDYESLKAVNPKIIYGQITGYGRFEDIVGYDAIIQAETGFMMINGEKESSPLKMPVALMDILAGHQLKEALLLAYIKLLQKGEGSFVDVSLLDSGLASLANQASNFLITGQEPQKQGSSHPNIAPYGDVFQSADNKQIILAVGNNKQFAALCILLEVPLTDKFVSNELRVLNRDELNSILSNSIIKWSSGILIDKLNKLKIPAGIVNTVSEALKKYASNISFNSDFKIDGLRTFIANGIERPKPSHILPPPHYGEHTTIILKEILGINHQKMIELTSSKVI
jgi:crotonobetainyl-CoA:carnitine CoA-transferase CaiB-like acyl-CoA transferase